MKGAIAAGSQAAIDAGTYALQKGGNAVDALIAAQLAATVAEPVLTGLLLCNKTARPQVLICFQPILGIRLHKSIHSIR